VQHGPQQRIEMRPLVGSEAAHDAVLVRGVVGQHTIGERAPPTRETHSNHATVGLTPAPLDQTARCESVDPVGHRARRDHHRGEQFTDRQLVRGARSSQRRHHVELPRLEPVRIEHLVESVRDELGDPAQPADERHRRHVDVRPFPLPLPDDVVHRVSHVRTVRVAAWRSTGLRQHHRGHPVPPVRLGSRVTTHPAAHAASGSGTGAVLVVVTLCGSLGPTSANRAVLDHATEVARRAGHVVIDAPSIETIKAFRSDHVDAPGEAVATLRAVVERADLVLLAAPEYAGGLAGAVKNALDWFVGSASLYERAVAVASAGTTGGPNALDQLARTLAFQGASVVTSLGIAAPRTKIDDAGHIHDPETARDVEHWVLAALDAVEPHAGPDAGTR
jgi:chromate reductase, NAD(P)H dehydrogenase (quinone)